MRAALVLLAGLSVTSAAPADEEARAHVQRGVEKAGKGQWSEAVAEFTRALEKDPKNVEALSGRGAAHFMLGQFKESVADFDREVELNPEAAPGHWRRGISLYYAGEYDRGRKQFEGYEKVDTNDVENAVWHFMCVARKDGLEKARKGILKIGKDRREVMMQVYDLFKGTARPADVLAAAEAGELKEEQRRAARFYANLYVGIWYDLAGDSKKAREHLRLADRNKIRHYMGEVPRVHLEVLKKKRD